jgi:tRNA 2-thiouridine synthesizing protein B
MMLFIVKSLSALSDAQLLQTEQDTILLVQDAVYAANPAHEYFPRLASFNASIVVLEEDIQARGLQAKIGQDYSLIDYSKWVELTAQHAQNVTLD